MNILYGVVGEGMGHATRSRVILKHLVKKHDVLIVASGKAFNYLNRFFPNVKEIEGFELSIENNAVDKSKSFAEFIKSLPKKSAVNLKRFIETSIKYKPDVVISDFESFSYIYGRLHNIPIISIDNMQIINRCDIEIPSSQIQDFLLAKTVVKGKLPKCYHYLITTFFFPEIRKEKTDLFGPILRDEVLNSNPSDSGHILVYQTSDSNDKLISLLESFKHEFIVYGFNENRTLGNIQFKEFSETGFIEDLASSQAVIASSGFSLMGEALYLKKPYLAIPLKKQFEQTLNGIYLKKCRYGKWCNKLTKEILNDFLERISEYQHNLQGFTHDRNRGILNKLDRILCNIVGI